MDSALFFLFEGFQDEVVRERAYGIGLEALDLLGVRLGFAFFKGLARDGPQLNTLAGVAANMLRQSQAVAKQLDCRPLHRSSTTATKVSKDLHSSVAIARRKHSVVPERDDRFDSFPALSAPLCATRT